MCSGSPVSRRTFVAGALASTALWSPPAASASAPEVAGNRVCAFVKFLQTLSYDALAQRIAELGFQGIEATVRAKGQIEPERVEEELPKLVEALRRRGLEITVMATDVHRADQPHTEKVLRTAAALGVRRYRMAYYRYDLSKPILPQLRELKGVVHDLVAMSRELGLSAVYQNHAGSDIVGAAVWDLEYLMRDYPIEDFAVAFDIRHATAEGGMVWPVHFCLMKPHLGMVFVKDFAWENRRARDVPLGSGFVDRRFFSMLREMRYAGPISLHVEYLETAGPEANLAALKADLKTLGALLGGRPS